jgi:centromeric protein E
MAATIPRPSAARSSNGGPPTIPLPKLPVDRTRKSTGTLQNPARLSSSSYSSITAPRSPSGLRASDSTTSLRDPVSITAASALQQRSPSSASNASNRTLRKVISINSFPQPPRNDSRLSGSLPGSPLVPESAKRAARRSRHSALLSPDSPTAGSPTSSTPSLLNGSGEGSSIPNARMSDGLISVASPPHSRSSSAQDSYSTSATTYDDPIDADGGAFKDLKGNVIVSVRVRPDPGSSAEEGEFTVDSRRALVSCRGPNGGDYIYDNVFATQDDNSRVYDCSAKRLVRRVMEGYHGTVFAYGMTGTGKTFSMQGTASSPGVIPLAITDIFSYIRETPSREFLLRVSYLEIYNERIHDLLSMSSNGGAMPQEEIKLREDSKRGVYATPLKEEIVQSPTQLLRVIARGDQARRTASTQFNSRSSRSHAVVQIVVESRERIAVASESKRSAILPGGVRVSTLSLIDLAGSEKAADTKERRTEGSHINKSLLTLGTVIARLSEQKKDGKTGGDKDGKHLPYRDSKLTRLLQGALSGNSLVSILCTMSAGVSGNPSAVATHMNETLNTLKFALRAKNSIVSHAKKGEEALGAGGEGGARVLLERYRMEIQELRTQLETQAKKTQSEEEDREMERDIAEERARAKEQELRHEEQMLEMQLARTALKERIDHLNRLILSSKSIGVNTNGSYSSLGMHSRMSQISNSVRSSMTNSVYSSFHGLSRSASMASTSSTIGRRSSAARRLAGGDPADVVEEEAEEDLDGDGMAPLAAQNRALQADLMDKNRYIATLEKRLLQARRTSASRTSVGLSGNKTIMVGEDHSVAALLKDKDAEIAELRSMLDDKDRMLTALRTVTRSRESIADPRFSRSSSSSTHHHHHHHNNNNNNNNPTHSRESSTTPSQQLYQTQNKSDEDLSILDEMIQDRVDKGHIIRSARGTVRVAGDKKKEREKEMEKEPLPEVEDFETFERVPHMMETVPQPVIDAHAE